MYFVMFVSIRQAFYMKFRRIFALLAVCLSLSLMAGCMYGVPSPFRPVPGPTKAPDVKDLAEAFDVVCRNYRLGPDDVLRLIFQTEWTVPAGSYKLDSLDEIRIEFILDPELNRTVTIRPDGMITLPGVGEIKAAGLAPEELARRIEQKFRQANIFRESEVDPKLKNYRLVTVTVVKFYEKVNKLVQSLTTLTRGQETTITVNPDGTIDLPLMKDRIVAVGHTVAEVEESVNRLYRQSELKHVVASVLLSSANSRRFYVLGHVTSGGAFDIRQPITILHAIATAGGATDSADLTSVMLISRNIHGKPIGRRIDVKRLLDVGDMSQMIMVKPYDVIYIPRTYIQDVRLFMDQYTGVVRDIAGFANFLLGR